MGETEVPISPQRVVVLDTTPLDAAIALGIEPVGTIRYGAGAKSISASLYPRLSQIAPTVFIEGAGYSWDWQRNFQLFARALGKPDEAEQKLDSYQQQLNTLKKDLDKLPETISVSVLSSTSNGLIAPSLSSFSGSIMEDLGLARNSAQGIETSSFVRLSKEDLAGADGDVLFLIYNPEWEDTPKEEFVADPVWSQLNAVKQGAVCEVAGDVWSSGRSVLAAQRILQDIENCFKQVF